MQLFALENGHLIFAHEAEKKKNYLCPECNACLRLREGLIKQPHFYHLQNQLFCRQNGKGMDHLQVQLFLKSVLKDAQIEVRFNEISRIADVAWEKEKIIFEVQCSFMSAQEMRLRTKDYKSIGWDVVWVLHEKTYNKWRVSAMEQRLLTHPHYYTNMDDQGRGFIYDQWSVIEDGLRKSSLNKLQINVTKVHRRMSSPYRDWLIGFEGDLSTLPENDAYRVKVDSFIHSKKIEERFSLRVTIKNLLRLSWRKLLKPYCE